MIRIQPQPFNELSPQGIIEAIETNLADASASLGRSEEAVVYRGCDVTWVYSGLPGTSRVMQARFADGEVDDRVAEVLSYFRQWNAGVSWLVGPSTYPTDLGHHLLAGGLGRADVWVGMARSLANLPAAAQLPAGLRIEANNELDTIRDWLTVGSLATKTPADQSAQAVFNAAADDACCRFYVAYQDDQPVARAMAFQKQEVAGVYWLSEVPAVRDRGIETAILQRILEDSQARNATLAVLAVQDDSQAAGSRMGFRPYCNFNVYSWPVPAPIPC